MKNDFLKEFETNNHWKYSIKYFNNIVVPKIESPYKKPIPAFLFKYLTIDRALDILKDFKIFLSHPDYFNDPSDCHPDLINYKTAPVEKFIETLNLKDLGCYEGITSENINDYFENNKEILISKTKFWRQTKSFIHLGIYCLCEDVDNYRLWSYYTSHSGVSFKFKISSLQKIKGMAGPFPVNYQNPLKSLSFEVDDDLCNLYQSNVKHSFWEGENEWRLLYNTNENLKSPMFDNYKKDSPTKPRTIELVENQKSIEAIYLGHKFFSDYEIIKPNELDLTFSVNTSIDIITDRNKKSEFLNKIIELEIPLFWVRFYANLNCDKKQIKLTKMENNKYSYEFIEKKAFNFQ